MLGSDGVEVEIFLHRALPHGIVLDVGHVVRFVPDLPILNTVIKAVCPSLVIVHYNVLADSRPFMKILGRDDVVGLDKVVVFDGYAQAVVGHNSAIYHARQKHVGKGEIVGCRVVFVCVEIGENVGNINVVRAAEASAGIVKATVGYVRRLHFAVPIGGVVARHGNHIVSSVHGLDLAYDVIKIYLDVSHLRSPF